MFCLQEYDSVSLHSCRLWIVQEQVLNDEIVMLQGKRCISWDAVAIMNVLFYLDILPHAWLPAIGQAMLEDATINEDLASFTSPWDMTGGVYSLWHDRQTAKRSQQSGAAVTRSNRSRTIVNPLFANLKRFECMKCSNAADRIFALLAISRDADELGIVPDYSRSEADNFRAASMAILINSKDIRFLNAIARWRNDASVGSERSSSWAINIPRTLQSRKSFHGYYLRWRSLDASNCNNKSAIRVGRFNSGLERIYCGQSSVRDRARIRQYILAATSRGRRRDASSADATIKLDTYVMPQ